VVLKYHWAVTSIALEALVLWAMAPRGYGRGQASRVALGGMQTRDKPRPVREVAAVRRLVVGQVPQQRNDVQSELLALSAHAALCAQAYRGGMSHQNVPNATACASEPMPRGHRTEEI